MKKGSDNEGHNPEGQQQANFSETQKVGNAISGKDGVEGANHVKYGEKGDTCMEKASLSGDKEKHAENVEQNGRYLI